MELKEVDVVRFQLAQALVDAAGSLLLAVVADPYLGDEEQVLALDARLGDGLAHAFLVEISLGSID